MKTIIAIDPGAGGGIAVHETGCPDVAVPMLKTQGDTVAFLGSVHSPCVCFLEVVSGFAGAKQPGSAMFKFGESYGFIKGVIQALNIPLVLVRPQEWQKMFALGTARACESRTVWKNKLKAEAQRRFPALTVTLKTADALLLLEYAKTRPEAL